MVEDSNNIALNEWIFDNPKTLCSVEPIANEPFSIAKSFITLSITIN